MRACDRNSSVCGALFLLRFSRVNEIEILIDFEEELAAAATVEIGRAVNDERLQKYWPECANTSTIIF